MSDHREQMRLLEARIAQAQQQIQAQQHLIAWMLSRFPEMDVQHFLDQWDTDCNGSQSLEEDAALIAALREDLPPLRAGHAFAQGWKR